MFKRQDPVDIYGNPVPDQRHDPIMRALGLGGLGTAAYAVHLHQLRTNPTYAQTLYRWASSLEEYSPGRILRTFGLSEALSSHLIQEVRIPHHHLVGGGGLSAYGVHLQRLLGPEVDVLAQTGGLHFTRMADEYLVLSGHPDARVLRFEQYGRGTGVSARFESFLKTESANLDFTGRWWQPGRLWANFQELRHTQHPKHGYESLVKAVLRTGVEHEMYVAPVAAGGEYLKNTHRFLFGMGERVQRMLAEIGVGLPAGSYNKLAHVPFMGRGGLLNQLLTKRVFPVIAGATALGYLDYLTGHTASNAAAALPFKANVLRADLTDQLPGARAVTDFYERTVPGSQYGPLALPIAGAVGGALVHYAKVLGGAFPAGERGFELRKAAFKVLADESTEASARLLKYFNRKSPVAWGLLAGTALMLPFLPGMFGSRRTGTELRQIYSGEEPVPIRAGRWWDLGSTPFEGSRIKAWRPHWLQLFRSRAERKSLYGSEEAYWEHNPLLHPLRYLRDPYWLEKQHYQDRPYPVASPAFSNVPLIGPLLAATIGKLVKPPVRMHEDEWSGDDYTLYSNRLEPRFGKGLPPPKPGDEYSLENALSQEVTQYLEFIGLPGFVARSAWAKAFPNYDIGQDVYFQGSRQMTNFSRRYYERELGAAAFMDPSGEPRMFGYTEPFRRFVQREQGIAQANEVVNTMPSWLPGEDYFIDFKHGDPYIKIDMGYARLPGAGYEALHPEVAGVDPEDYDDLTRFRILGDVAPYSSEFAAMRGRVGAQAKRNTDVAIEYSKVLDRVERTKRSVVRTAERRFSAPTEQISGTVSKVSPAGVELEEFPGRYFHFSSIGTSAADLSAAALAEQNDLNRSQLGAEVERRQGLLWDYLNDQLGPGTGVELTIPKGAAAYGEDIFAVVEAHGNIINQELVSQGLAQYRRDVGGAEAGAMHSVLGRMVGSLAEAVSFTGDQDAFNPLRLLPTPGHTKLWQQRTALAQYEEEEAIGSRMRRWHRPVHDFLAPYLRGAIKRLTGQRVIGEDTLYKRDLNTLADVLSYLRAKQSDRYTNQASRTAVGANLFASPTFLASTLPDREAHYFRRFVAETDPQTREQILGIVPSEMARALAAQWTAAEARIAEAEGEAIPPLGEGGRLYTEEDLEEYRAAKTRLSYGDYVRSREMAEFFSRTGFHLPEEGSAVWDDVMDYQDVKLKILQQEGYDMHDFAVFEDRAALLWRKPWLDGAARELTSGEARSVENLRRQIEMMMLAAGDRDPDVRVAATKSHRARGEVRLDVDVNQERQLMRDMRRHPERYESQ